MPRQTLSLPSGGADGLAVSKEAEQIVSRSSKQPIASYTVVIPGGEEYGGVPEIRQTLQVTVPL